MGSWVGSMCTESTSCGPRSGPVTVLITMWVISCACVYVIYALLGYVVLCCDEVRYGVCVGMWGYHVCDRIWYGMCAPCGINDMSWTCP